jgi:hypothetical protein
VSCRHLLCQTSYATLDAQPLRWIKARDRLSAPSLDLDQKIASPQRLVFTPSLLSQTEAHHELTHCCHRIAPPDTDRWRKHPTQRLDRLTHAALAPLSGGLSPVSLALAMADLAWHLGVSPGRQLELAELAAQLAQDTARAQDGMRSDAGKADDDPRFRHEAWANWPFSQIRTGFRNTEAFWREATRVPGMTAHHADMTRFFAKQWLGMMAPANWLLTNPVVLQDVVESRGAPLDAGRKELARGCHRCAGRTTARSPQAVFRWAAMSR